MPARSPYPKCPACHRKHDPRFTTTKEPDADEAGIMFGYAPPAMIIHRHVLYFCWYKAGLSYDELVAKHAEKMRERKRISRESEELLAAWNRLNPDEWLAWVEAKAQTKLAREHKLDAIRRLANDPRTPAGEAQAARRAIQRLTRGS